MKRIGLISVLGTAIFATAIVSVAQVPGQKPAFEVASIKPSKADASSSGINTGNGRISGNNVTLKRCIMGAYAVGPNQIVGGPDWLDLDRFEITAKAEEPVGDTALMTMLQTLLAERFKLALHRESKPTDVYVLERANKEPKLEKGDGKGATTNNGRGNIVAKNASMDRFAETLSRQMDRPVVNQTGLPGVFNLTLQWTPDTARPARTEDGARIEGPSVFTAIQEQLGLRLRAQKVPVEVLVIDSAQRPSEN
jgi:uncharacterized protein (TIGR03435 family)